MSYPRKRALLACDFCRQRKRRCDGRKPICGNCAEAEADCHYQELPIQRLMAGNLPSAMAKRLERIEALLKVHSDAIAELTEGSKKGECNTSARASGNGNEVGKGEEERQIAALEQSHEDIEHDIPAVLTYLATSGQHHDYGHAAARQNRSTPGALSSASALDSRVRKPPSTSSSYRTTTTTNNSNNKHASTPDHRLLLREDSDHKLTHLHAHVPSPPNSTSSAASATASVNGLSPPLHTIAPAPAPAPAPPSTMALDVPKPGTSTSSLLAFPTLRSLVGGFPPDYFLRIEMQRAAPPPASSLSASAAASVGVGELDLPYLNRDVTDLLVTTFFAVVHPSHPLFGGAQSRRRARFLDVYEDVVRRGLGRDARSVLCLVVFALGAIASSSTSSSTTSTSSSSASSFSGSGAGAGAGARPKRDTAPGMEFFLPAQQIMTILDAQTFTGDATLAAALVLGGVYLSYVREPVKSWKVVCMAGRQVQLCGMSGSTNTNSDDDGEGEGEGLLVQVACACYSLEQELYSEFGLPSSGVAGFVDSVFFAQGRDARFHAHEHDPRKYAEISLQRIIARAHDALYAPASPQQQQQQPSLSLPSALSLAADFERQLALWYDDAFATATRSDLSPGHGATSPTSTTSDDREKTLRLRYWEARIVVFKPFLLFLAEAEADRRGGNGEEIIPAVVFDKASACVESCRLYITAAAEMLKKPARHTWATCQLSIHAVLLCTIASMAPRLAHWVPDVAELQQCVMDGVGASACAWAVPESSAEAGVWVVGDIRRRQRFCLGR